MSDNTDEPTPPEPELPTVAELATAQIMDPEATKTPPPVETTPLGSVNFVTGRENFTGVGFRYFDNPEALEAFSTENPGVLVLQATPAGGDRILASLTRQLTAEQSAELAEIQREVGQALLSKNAAREKAAKELEVERGKAELELKRLVEVGRQCENHHKGILDENRTLRDENKKLKKRVENARR